MKFKLLQNYPMYWRLASKWDFGPFRRKWNVSKLFLREYKNKMDSYQEDIKTSSNSQIKMRFELLSKKAHFQIGLAVPCRTPIRPGSAIHELAHMPILIFYF